MARRNHKMSSVIYTAEHRYIVEQLKRARRESGLTQTEVVKLLGRTQSYLSTMESGQCRIDIVQLKKFAGIYTKDLGFFIRDL